MPNPLSYLHDQLEQWRAEGTYQKLRILETASAAEARFDGKEVINLASNNYLGSDDASQTARSGAGSDSQIRRGQRRGAHHLRHHEHTHATGGAHRGV